MTAAAGIIFGGVSTFMSVKAADEAKKAGDLNAQRELAATEEAIRRLDVQEADVLGTQTVTAARQNVDINSPSVLALRTEAMNEFDAQRESLEETGAQAGAAAQQAGTATAYQSYGNALSSASQTVGSLTKAWQNWFP